MRAEGAVEPRITLTLPPIVNAKKLFLHIEGNEKHDVYKLAGKPGPVDDYPIRHVLRHKNTDLQVYWAP